MRDFTEESLTKAVLQALDRTPDKRLQQIMTSLIAHVHAFAREVELTEGEWFQGIKFLTEVGHKCDEFRQEFILLSDTLGISMLVDHITHRAPAGATETTVLGPFYRDGAPALETGSNIAQKTPGDPTFVSGRVTGLDGKPIGGALLDVWQAGPNGFYEGQHPSVPEWNLRGKFRTDAEGRYAFRTVKPASYPIPMDGPVGRMITALGRPFYRPGHIHFIFSAKGYERLCTHIFVAGDPCLDSDPVFVVKSPLIADFVRHDSIDEAKARGTTAPFYAVEYNFVLKPAA